MKAFREIGPRKALRYFGSTLFLGVFRLILFPQVRTWYLRLAGATIGAATIIHDVRFFNAYRTGFKGLRIGKNCFLGDECLLDLADSIVLGDHVTLAERVVVITHINVGYLDHPLQPFFPASQGPVVIEPGAFVGTNATILSGVQIGRSAFVAAGSVVTESVPALTLVGGIPARPIRRIS